MNLIARMAIPCLLASVAYVGPSASADYDPPLVIDAPEAVDEFVPVEVGSGWYLRGDVGYPMNKPFRHSSVPMGAGTFEDETSLLTGSVGMGYQFNSFLRAELNASILPSNRFARVYTSNCSGTETTIITDAAGNPIAGNINSNASRPCMGSDEARNKAYNVGASGFVDLGTFIGFTPYVGGGVGVTYNKSALSAGMKDCIPTTNTTGFTSVDFACDRPVEYAGTRTSQSRYDFSYSLAAGVAYQVSQNVKLELGYEYLASPTARYVVFDGVNSTVHKGVDYHQVKLGVRYALW
jgi:opacity protein-like surface antigen